MMHRQDVVILSFLSTERMTLAWTNVDERSSITRKLHWFRTTVYRVHGTVNLQVALKRRCRVYVAQCITLVVVTRTLQQQMSYDRTDRDGCNTRIKFMDLQWVLGCHNVGVTWIRCVDTIAGVSRWSSSRLCQNVSTTGEKGNAITTENLDEYHSWINHHQSAIIKFHDCVFWHSSGSPGQRSSLLLILLRCLSLILLKVKQWEQC